MAEKKSKAKSSQIKVVQIASPIGRRPDQKQDTYHHPSYKSDTYQYRDDYKDSNDLRNTYYVLSIT